MNIRELQLTNGRKARKGSWDTRVAWKRLPVEVIKGECVEIWEMARKDVEKAVRHLCKLIVA